MSESRSVVPKLMLFAVVIVAAVGFQMWRNGTAQKYLSQYLPVKESKLSADTPPEVVVLIDNSLKRAQTTGKVPVIRFNLKDCAICERVSRDVFTKPEWGKFAAEKLEITDYLMPTSFTSEQPELMRQMQMLDLLAKASGADQGFPFIAVLAKDGSLLGARAGYHAGGAEDYIRWVEKLSAADKSAPKQFPEKAVTSGKAPTPETAKASAPVTKPAPAVSPAAVTAPSPVQKTGGPATNVTTGATLEIVVKGLSGSGAAKVVLLGIGQRNYPLFSGDKKRVQFNNASLVVECREIGDKEVVVKVEGEDKERRLPLKLD